MSFDASQWAWKQQVTSTQKLILLSLADRASDNHSCFPSIDRLVSDTGLNRKTVLSGLKALGAIGLITTKKTKRTSGQYCRNSYQLIGVSGRETLGPENGTRNSKIHVPILPKTTSQNWDSNQPTNLPVLKKERKKKKELSKWEAPDWINMNAWSEYEQHRLEMKKPMSDLARGKAIKPLMGLSLDQQQAVIDKTIQNGWTGLFPVQDKKYETSNAARRSEQGVFERGTAGAFEPWPQ
jgi:hypothetical protein